MSGRSWFTWELEPPVGLAPTQTIGNWNSKPSARPSAVGPRRLSAPKFWRELARMLYYFVVCYRLATYAQVSKYACAVAS